MKLFNWEIKKKIEPIKVVESEPGQSLDDLRKEYDEWHQTVIRIGNRPVLFTTKDLDGSRPDRTNSNIGACIKLIANKVSTLPIKIQRKARVDGKMTWVDEDEHEALILFNRPNAYNNQIDLITHDVQSLVITGRCLKVKDSVYNKPPSALWLHPSWMFDNRYDKSTGLPNGFVYDRHKTNRLYEPEEVIFTHFYDMSNPFDSPNPMSAIMSEVKSNFYALNWHEAFFKNSATPELLFVNNSLAGMSPEAEKEFLKDWAKRHQGYKKAYKTGILPSGMDIRQIERKIADMMLNAMIELNREQLLSFMMVPPAELGILKDASYANALLQDKVFWGNNLIPLLMIDFMSYDHQLIWPHWGDGFRVRPDLSNVAALQEDKVSQSSAHRAYLYSGALTINDVRQEIGKSPHPHPFANMVRPEINEALALMGLSQSEDNTDKGIINSLYSSKSDDEKPDPRVIHWHVFDEKTASMEPKFADIMTKYFEGELKRVLNNIREKSANGLLMSSYLYKMHISPDEIKRGTDDELPDQVSQFMNMKEEDEALAAATKKSIEEAVADAGQAFIASHGLDISFNLKDPKVLEKIAQQNNRIKYINDDTYKQLRSLLDTAYEDGWNLSQLESAIKELYNTWIDGNIVDGEKLMSRVKTVARTEMATAVNGGDYLGQLQAGVKYHEWLATVDGRTRPEHSMADGQKISISEAFTVGGEKLMYPSDPAGSAWNTINCRCTTLEHFE